MTYQIAPGADMQLPGGTEMDPINVKRHVDDHSGDQVLRVHPAAYSDPELFELKMQFTFGRT